MNKNKEIKVKKRNGELVDYDGGKIIDAIMGAMKASECDNSTIASAIEHAIFIAVRASKESLTVEEISDMIEKELWAHGLSKIYKNFVTYRGLHTENRMVKEKQEFINDYKTAENASTGSKFDPNANVENKNMSTLSSELFKRESILLNRRLMTDKMTELYGSDVADEYLRQLNTHEIYKHDETSILPYCVSINMYPFITEGLSSLGGHSTPPTHLQSFNGSFINLVFAVASQFAGAVATPEYLMYMDYFVRKGYGDDYYLRKDEIVDISLRQRSIEKVVEDSFQQVVYSLNQPASARGYQAVFWNIGYFDKFYFDSMFGDFYFPDGTQPTWESVSWLQKKFMKWFNAERTKATLTFPVETMAMLTKDGDIRDKEYADYASEMYAEGHSFFTYLSDSADSLSSCCRLRNPIADNEFSFSLGAGGVATGSKSVITMNVNRLVQNAVNANVDISEAISEQTLKIHKYQIAFNEIMKENFNSNLMPAFSGGFITLDKQFLTVGINGMVESAEFMGIEVKADNPKYKLFIDSILKPIYDANKKAKTKETMFNTEFVPAENLGVKHAKWDRADGYFVPRAVYNSYFYIVEDETTSILDKFKLHGADSVQYLDGGSALHCNLDEHLSKEQYRQLFRVAAQTGCNYFTYNIPNTICNKCGIIDKRMLKECPNCGSTDLDYLTRVIGYMKRVSSFSIDRQIEERKRFYANLR